MRGSVKSVIRSQRREGQGNRFIGPVGLRSEKHDEGTERQKEETEAYGGSSGSLGTSSVRCSRCGVGVVWSGDWSGCWHGGSGPGRKQIGGNGPLEESRVLFSLTLLLPPYPRRHMIISGT